MSKPVKTHTSPTVVLQYPPHKHLPRKVQRAFKDECFARYKVVYEKACAVLRGEHDGER